MTIEPSYFSANGQNLLGIYHPPEAGSMNEAVLICPPVFGEYLRSHGAIRRIALAIAARGAHAFRFDYRGTGDSGGDFQGASVGQWLDDVFAAISELRALTGVRRVRLIGVRLGGALAALASMNDREVARVVLWDPILDGATYMRQLQTTHQRLLDAHVVPRSEDTPLPSSGELLGYPVGDELIHSISSLEIPRWTDLASQTSCEQVLFTTHESWPDHQELAEASSSGIEHRRNALDCNWNTFKESVLLPGKFVTEIVDAAL